MASRDLGTAVLNIKIGFDKVNTTDMKAKLAQIASMMSRAFEDASKNFNDKILKTKTLVNNARRLGQQTADAFNQGISNGIKQGAGGKSPFLDPIKNLEKDLKAIQARIQGFFAPGISRTPDQRAVAAQQLREFRQQEAEIKKQIALLREKARINKELNVETTSSKRIAEQERSNRSLERNSDLVIKVTGKLKELANAFSTSSGGAERLNTFMSAGFTVLEKNLTSLVKTESKYKSTEGVLKSLASTYDQLKTSIEKTIVDPARQQDLVTQLNKAREGAEATLRKLSERKSISESVALGMGSRNRVEIRDEINRLVRVRTALQTLKEDTNQVDVAIAKLQKHIRELNKEDLNNIRRSFHTVTSGVNQFGEQLRRVSFIFRDIGRQMLTFGKQGMGMIQPNIKEFMDFEQAIVDVLAVTGDLTAGFDQVSVSSTQLGSFILDLASKSRFSAQEIAGAAKTLALAGFTLDQINNSLQSLTTLAAATGSDLASTTNLIVSTISSFQLAAEESAKLADIFTAAVTRSNTGITQLGEAMKIVAPTASALGQDISQVTAGLGLLANAGVRGTMAGTGLSRIFTQLIEKSDKLDDMLRGLGSSFDRINPEKVGLVDIVKEFERLNLSTQQLQTIFDQRGFRAFLSIMNQGSAELVKLNEEMTKAQGLAEFLAKQRLNTLAGSVQLLNDGIVALRISLGELVTKEMKQLADFARSIVDLLKQVVTNNQEQVKALAKTFMGLVAVLTTLGGVLFSIGAAFSFLAAPFIGLGAALAGVNTLVGTTITLISTIFPAALAAAGTATAILTTKLLIVSGVFAAVSAAIATFTGAIVLALSAVSIGIFQNFDVTMNYIKMWIAEAVKLSSEFAADFGKGWASGVAEFNAAFEQFLITLTKVGIVLGDSFGGNFATTFGKVVINALTLGLKTLNSIIDAFLFLKNTIQVFDPILREVSLKFFEFYRGVSAIAGPLTEIAMTFGAIVAQAAGIAALPVIITVVRAGMVMLLALLRQVFIAISTFIATNPLFALAVILGVIVDRVIAILQYFKILRGSAEDVRKAQEGLNRAISDNVTLMERLNQLRKESIILANQEAQGILNAGQKIVDSIKERTSLIRNISETDPTVFGNEISGETQDKVFAAAEEMRIRLLSAQRGIERRLSENRVVMQPDEVKAYEAQIESLKNQQRELQTATENYDRVVFYTTMSLKGNNEVIREGIEGETARSKSLSGIINKFDELAAVVSSEDIFSAFRTSVVDSDGIPIEGQFSFFGVLGEAEKMVNELNQAFGQDFKLTSWESFTSIIDFIATSGKDAVDVSKEQLAQLKAMQVILAQYGDMNFDMNTEEGRKAFAERQEALRKEVGLFNSLAKLQDAESEHMKGIAALRKSLADEGKTQYQLAKDALNEEISKREEILENQIKYLKIRTEILKREMQSADLTEEQRTNKEKELAEQQAALDEMQGLAGASSAADTRRKEKMTADNLDARKAAEVQIAEISLETEQDVERRIALRSKIIEAKFEAELKTRLEALKALYDPTDPKDRAEVERATKELQDAIAAAKAKELQDAVAAERKDPQAEKVVEKRIDLETELLNNLGKQVTTLQQMAMLMKFIEALQARKDRRALESARKLSEERRKLADLEMRAALGDPKAEKALDAKMREVAVLEGIFQRNKGVAGANQGGGQLFNIDAFFAMLGARLDKFVQDMLPLVIPMEIDTEKLLKDLTEALKGFNINDALGGIIPGGMNIGTNNRLVGANFGTINHVDNSSTTVNIRTMDEATARRFGIVK